eukprot:TRINITY_DN7104_c0_g1_i2.p1 TRINITY_DN7104_c0_g1~~TRINITY_DN7104_c0_g1_i2.p1  ORF type:complete len:193 (-),score=19.51 TRINITY_DN7104_c0_g1_i2:76-654(-)
MEAQRPKGLLRPPKVTTITSTAYKTLHWPRIQHLVTSIIEDPTKSFSQEELYRAVYNVCVQRHSSLIWEDLRNLLINYLDRLLSHLMTLDEHSFLPALTVYFKEFRRALDFIKVGFRYLEKNHLETKLQTSLDAQFLGMYRTKIIEDQHILDRLRESFRSLPFRFDPVKIIEDQHILDRLRESFRSFSIFAI